MVKGGVEVMDNITTATGLALGGIEAATGEVILGSIVRKVTAEEIPNAVEGMTIQFGKTENQVFHAFRHIDDLNLDRTLVQSTIENHFKSVSSKITAGKPFNQVVEIEGQKIQYTAFKLPDGTINIGRIHGTN